MVYPTGIEAVRIVDDNVQSRITPRRRLYLKNNDKGEYIVYLNGLGGAKIRHVALSNKIHKDFASEKVFFVSKSKLRIIFSTKEEANKFATDDSLLVDYNIYIPAEGNEVKCRIPLDRDISEKEIYQKLTVFNTEMGDVQLLEVRRILMRKDFDDPSSEKVSSENVVLTFSGEMAPSHVEFEKLIIPVYPYYEGVLQYRKCWFFGHSKNVCRSNIEKCVKCGKAAHSKEIDCALKCLLCGEEHAANSRNCRLYVERKNVSKKNAERVLFRRDLSANQEFDLSVDEFPSLEESFLKRKRIDGKIVHSSLPQGEEQVIDNKRKRKLFSDRILMENSRSCDNAFNYENIVGKILKEDDWIQQLIVNINSCCKQQKPEHILAVFFNSKFCSIKLFCKKNTYKF